MKKKTIVIVMLFFLIAYGIFIFICYQAKSKNDDENESELIEENYNMDNDADFSDTRVPICPAHPEGAKVFPGSEGLYGGNEHKGCTTEHCLLDLREEKRKQYLQNEREQLEQELGY